MVVCSVCVSRIVSVSRAADGSFGFVLSGQDPVWIKSVMSGSRQDPVWIKSVMSGSAADKAGLGPGDAILQLNGIDVRLIALS